MSPTKTNDQSDLVGRVVLERYRIVRAIARGGMDVTYLALMEGEGFVKPVVVKRMPLEHADESALKMLKREARIMSRLRHPGIVSVTDFGRENGDFLFVMDYVHGFHLGRWASYVQQNGVAGQLFWPLATHIIIQVLDALEYAHTLRGTDGQPVRVVHRDVSPSNVLLDVDGRVLLDFGIAKSAGEDDKTVVGRAPEIFEGHPPESSSDVYSAAVVLHEILTGRNEFRAGEPATTIQRVLNHVPRRLDAVRPEIPAALADVVARALDKDLQVRFKTAGEFAKALRRVRGMDGEEASDALRKTLDRDFRDPRFAAMFELPKLDSLEQAWRTSPDAEDSRPLMGAPVAYRDEPKLRLTIASPCTESWDAMEGTARVRHCDRCNKKVFNLSQMLDYEVRELLRASNEPPCVMFYQRMDGTVLTKDCPRGKSLKWRWFAAGVLLAAALLVVGAGCVTLARDAVCPSDVTRPRPAAGRAAPLETNARITQVINDRIRDALPALRRCAWPEESRIAFEISIRTNEQGHPERVELLGANALQNTTRACFIRTVEAIEFGPLVGANRFRVPFRVSP